MTSSAVERISNNSIIPFHPFHVAYIKFVYVLGSVSRKGETGEGELVYAPKG